MSEPPENWIFVFQSIHHVLAAERALLQRGLWCDLVPTPREIHTDCGMVVEFHRSDLEAVLQAIGTLTYKPRDAFRRSEDGYQAIPLEAEAEGS
jgi:hypothetical protein